MFERIKKLLGITKKEESDKFDEVYLYEEDENLLAMLDAVMSSGKPCIGTVDENGKLTIKELDSE